VKFAICGGPEEARIWWMPGEDRRVEHIEFNSFFNIVSKLFEVGRVGMKTLYVVLSRYSITFLASAFKDL